MNRLHRWMTLLACMAAAGCGQSSLPPPNLVVAATPNVEAAKPMPARTIHFPKEFNIGTLGLRPSEFVGGWRRQWEKAGNAQGDIEVPANTYALLTGSRNSKTIASLAELQPDDLQALDLISPELTDEAIAPIGKLTGLRHLSLPPGITDAGVAHVKGLVELNDLQINGPGITAAALEHVKDLPKLKRLYHQKTSIDAAALEAFQQSKPGIKVIYQNEDVKLSDIKMPAGGIPGNLPFGGGGKKKGTKADAEANPASPLSTR